jgi:hypothetical protein
MRKLWELVTLAAIGCSSINETDAKINPAVQTAQDSKNEVRKEVIDPLKEYLYAQYDISALRLKRDDIPELESKLSRALTAAGLSAEAMQKLKEGKSSPELEDFFDKQGLLFRALRYVGSTSPINYELVKIGSKEEKEMALFEIKQKYTKVRIVEPEIITNAFTYMAQKKNLPTAGLGNAVWYGKKTIEYRVAQGEFLAKNYFDGEKKEWDSLEAELNDWKKIDAYYFGKKNKQPHQLFYDHMGTVLHHVAVRGIFKESKDEDEFKKKIMPIWEREADIRNVMMVIDDFGFDEVTKGLTDKDAKDLSANTIGHRETRAMLAQMYHGTPHQYMGDMFKSVAMPSIKEFTFRRMASTAVLEFFALQVRVDRDTYKSIDITGYKPGDEGIIFAQFGNLSADQIKKLAKDTFDALYHGRELKDYMLDIAKEMKKKYD